MAMCSSGRNSFLQRVAGVSLKDRVWILASHKTLLFHIKGNQLRWFRYLIRMPPRYLLGTSSRGVSGMLYQKDPGADPGDLLAWESLSVPPWKS